MAKRRKSTHRRRVRHNPPAAVKRRAYRRYRRNPPALSVKGIVGDTVQGVKDALAIEAGKAVTNFVSRMVPISSAVPAVAVRVAVSIAASVAAKMAFGREAARLVLAGGLSVPIESAVRAANVPLLSGALSSDEEISRYFRAVGAYPQRRIARTVGAYPTRGVGDMAIAPGMAAVGGGSYF